MNEKIAPKTIMGKTTVPGFLRLENNHSVERAMQRMFMDAMVADVDDMMTGGHRRLARQAEHAREQMAAQRLEREAQAVLDHMVSGAGAVWGIVKTIEHDRSCEDEVLAVFYTEEAAKTALARLSGMPDLSISKFPFLFATG